MNGSVPVCGASLDNKVGDPIQICMPRLEAYRIHGFSQVASVLLCTFALFPSLEKTRCWYTVPDTDFVK
jgi:hypothetical protein